MNGARVVKPDIQATNGVIHVVDRVLFPVPEADIYNTLRKDPQQRFTTLVSAIDRAGLQLVLGDPRGKSRFNHPLNLPTISQIAISSLHENQTLWFRQIVIDSDQGR